MTNSSLRFSAVLDAYNKNLIISDTNTWTGVYQSVLLKVTSTTLGITIYENIGFASDDYSSPDMIIGFEDSFTIPLTLDSVGNIICGDYKVEYKVLEVESSTSTGAELLGTTYTNSGEIDVDLQDIPSSPSDRLAFANDVLAQTVLNITAGSNVGLYKLITGSYDSLTEILHLEIEGTFDAVAIDDIMDIATPDSTASYTTSNTFTYCYTKPTVGIEIVPTCSQSTLYSEDTTDYNAENYGTMYYPTTLTRTHTVQPPLGSSLSPTQNSSTKITILPNIWTGIWQSTVNSVIEYSIKKWSNTVQDYWFFISDIIEGYAEKDVQCKTCYCELASCTQKLYNDWIRTLATNPSKAAWYGEAMLKMTSLWMQYQQAVACGTNSDDICDQMAVILTDNDCHCDLITNEKSKEVIPVSEIYGAGSGSKIYFGTGAPNVALGGDEDTYINSTNMDVYYKENGAWGLKGTMKGEKGETGEAGATWTSGSGVPSNASGNNGDFYLRTTNGNVYKKTAGVWEVDAYMMGAAGAAATINVGTVTESYNITAPTVVNGGSTSAASLDFEFPKTGFSTYQQKVMKFSDSYVRPFIGTISEDESKPYDDADAIKIVSINRSTKKIVLNHIPADVNYDDLTESSPSTDYRWMLFGYGVPDATQVNGLYQERVRITAIDKENKELTYDVIAGSGTSGGYRNCTMVAGSSVAFKNMFAHIDFQRTTFMLKKNDTVATGAGTANVLTSHAAGIMKNSSTYYFVHRAYFPTLPAAGRWRLIAYSGSSESAVTSVSTPDWYVDDVKFTATSGHTLHSTSGFGGIYLRNVTDSLCDYWYVVKLLEGGVAVDYFIIYSVDYLGNISNVRKIAYDTEYLPDSRSGFAGAIYTNGYYRVFMYTYPVTSPVANLEYNLYELYIHKMGDGTMKLKMKGNINKVSPYDKSNYNANVFSTLFSTCDYKGLLLVPYHYKADSKWMSPKGNYQCANLAYYDIESGLIKDMPKTPELFFPVELDSTHSYYSGTSLFGTNFGYDHTEQPVLFHDKDEDILFVFCNNTYGADTYSTMVGRFKFRP